LIYAPDGSITGVRHAWTFDDMFSTYALQGIKTKASTVARNWGRWRRPMSNRQLCSAALGARRGDRRS
jgi:hypothetical protein